MKDNDWCDILKVQPMNGARLLMRWMDGTTRIGTYNSHDFRFWGVKEYKDMPDGNRQPQG